MSKLNEQSELTNYNLWQQERYGNILPAVEVTPEGELFETGIEELNRLAQWITMQTETQLLHLENC